MLNIVCNAIWNESTGNHLAIFLCMLGSYTFEKQCGRPLKSFTGDLAGEFSAFGLQVKFSLNIV